MLFYLLLKNLLLATFDTVLWFSFNDDVFINLLSGLTIYKYYYYSSTFRKLSLGSILDDIIFFYYAWSMFSAILVIMLFKGAMLYMVR